MNFLDPNILDYALKFTTPPSEILQELNRETNYKVLMPRMMSSPLMGSFLSFISNIIKPKYILEIGTYTGYSAICLAEGLIQNGELHTIEINEELSDFSLKYFKKANLDQKIKLHNGNAIEIIPTLNMKFDLIFIDADKKNYCHYYELALSKIKKGGYILIDNVLWNGKVLKKAKEKDFETKEIQKLNKHIQSDERVRNMLIPLRDGVMVCQVL